MPCHHKLEEYLDAYIKAAGIADNRKGLLFRDRQDGETQAVGHVAHGCLVHGAPPRCRCRN